MEPGAGAREDFAGWRERESEVRTRSREDNESTARSRGEAAMTSFRCECGDPACTHAIHLTTAEYESVRAFGTRFAIARDHENPESEQLIEEQARFAIVETISGEAVKRARTTNPRHWRRQERP
jgi:hypothetical protein